MTSVFLIDAVNHDIMAGMAWLSEANPILPGLHQLLFIQNLFEHIL